jgi:hypothetical protein
MKSYTSQVPDNRPLEAPLVSEDDRNIFRLGENVKCRRRRAASNEAAGDPRQRRRATIWPNANTTIARSNRLVASPNHCNR